ncbi:hypothetical protein EXIGLDRAFT_629898 [Exidia glandulosa HHB12029]|uniref:CxC2-like cysteine cluster KDZ transposase-associated domain-containing protein n=1 Tax=Exidia glandulosa HHB12029 TaxID=1314781 RepID=A0A165BGG4_EXIGL|nr:hypothetical protein EXIGLDRAFT_629898 [Exidia glandulosa HHB12029]
MKIVPDVLDALFDCEVDTRVGDLCLCGNASPVYRCIDCTQRPPSCNTCLASSHRHSPLHRVQKWTGAYFCRSSLSHCGLRWYLGHDGSPCPAARGEGVASTIVDVNGLHSMDVVYCGCRGAAAPPRQLLAASLYPASWTSPRTAFTFRLMKHHHLDSLQSRKPAYDYWALLRRLTDNTRGDGVPDRYEELLRASREWRCLMRLKRSGQELGIAKHLPHGSTSVGVTCVACPRPGFNMPANWKEMQTAENAYINGLFLGIDGNFRAVLKVKKHDADDVPLLDGRSYFVSTEPFLKYQAAAPTDPNESTCSDLRSMHMVTNRKGVLVTGIIAVVCVRHSCYCLNAVLDMTLGEKCVCHSLLDHRVTICA